MNREQLIERVRAEQQIAAHYAKRSREARERGSMEIATVFQIASAKASWRVREGLHYLSGNYW
jgi:hypothetical protein